MTEGTSLRWKQIMWNSKKRVEHRKKMKSLMCCLFLVGIGIGGYIWGTVTTSASSVDYMGDEVTTAIINDVAGQYGVAPELIEAITEYESSARMYNSDGSIVRNGNCVGIMQVNENLYADRAKELGVDLYTEYGNVVVGTDVLMEMADEYEDLYTVLMMYNMGEYSKADEMTDNGQVSDYAKKIVERSDFLQKLHHEAKG